MEAEEDRWVDLRCDLWLAILTMAMLTGGLARAAILRFVTANANANSSRERRGVAMEAGGSRRVERGDEAQTRLGRRGRAAGCVVRLRRADGGAGAHARLALRHALVLNAEKPEVIAL